MSFFLIPHYKFINVHSYTGLMLGWSIGTILGSYFLTNISAFVFVELTVVLDLIFPDI